MSDSPPGGEQRPFIELEPAVSSSARAAPASLPDGVTPEMLDAQRTVPSQPAHVCPTCDYNLTGLSSRRCPECGEAFTLAEARMAAFALSEPMTRYVRHRRWNRFKLVLGVGLMAASFVAVNWIRPPATLVGPPVSQLTLPGVVLLAMIFVIVVALGLFRALFEMSWSNALLVAGLFVAMIAFLIM
jgi:hypothetical protein